jgi:hypothetical protein
VIAIFGMALTFLRGISLKQWLYFGAAVAFFIGYALFVNHQRAIGEAKCELAHAAEQAKINELQSRLDAQADKQNAPVLDRYNTLTEALATYDRTPLAVAGCGRVPDDIVRAVNAAHTRKL